MAGRIHGSNTVFNSVRVGVFAQTKSLFRAPLTLGLMLALPIVSIELFAVSMASFPETMFAELAITPAAKGRITGAIFATAAISGILGLFQMISARQTDDRLLRCGTNRLALLLARLVTVGIGSVVVAGVSLGLLAWQQSEPESLGGAFLVLVGVGVMYSLIGVLLGSVLPRKLEGSLLLITLADMDNIFASAVIPLDTDLFEYFPMYYPHALLQSMVVDGTASNGDRWGMVTYVVVLLTAALAVYLYTTRSRGD